MARTDPGEAEYTALTAGLDEHHVPCTGLDFYTADTPDEAQLAYAARLCASCPIRALCEAYAKASNPPAGIWAGRAYPQDRRKKTP